MDKIKLGIVTTPEGAVTFYEVLRKFPQVQYEMMMTRNDKDIRGIIMKAQSQLDVIVFSGPLSYYMNRQYVPEHIPTVGVGYNQIELMKGMLQLQMSTEIPFAALSIDTFSDEAVEGVARELGLPMREIFNRPFHPKETNFDIVNFHLDKWTRGAAKQVITARGAVFDELERMSIPVIKVFPTLYTVQEAVSKAVLLGHSSKNMEAQILVCMFTLTGREREPSGERGRERLQAEFEQELTEIARQIDACIVPSDSLEYTLYTNRGYLDTIREFLQNDMIRRLHARFSAKLCVGLGLGKTALSAQSHARLALQHARSQGGDCGFLVRDDGKIIGPLGTERAIDYEYKTDKTPLLQMAKESRLSIDTVSKFVTYTQKRDKFVAEDLAYVLNVTPRHVRNVINIMMKLSYVRPIGEERPYPRGRPRKIYTFNAARFSGQNHLEVNEHDWTL